MLNQQALEYHRSGRKGKIEVRPTKPSDTQQDLSLAYTPGVASPCLEIERDPALAYEYTTKGNLVAVISNGTAVLGLGDIGPQAGKPVMEGKGLLFKKFADIDVFDLEIAEKDPDMLIRIVKSLEPTFGGINLEDIKAPECFYIETELRRQMSIPVFHDDQHGTAIITGAALLNGAEVAGKKLSELKVVFSGAGASGIATAKLYVQLGVKRENIVMCDSRGVIYKGRDAKMEPNKALFAAETKARTLADALKDADMFVGLSQPNIVTPDMLRSMAKRPMVFALANPDPEVRYETVREVRPDSLTATGRSDYPNQINNVLGFPFIFRGALDVRAREINEPMKLAAVRALAALAHEDIPDEVLRAYGKKSLSFGPDYLIPSAFDPRILMWVAPAVAQAAIESKVARITEFDLEAYRDRLAASQGVSRATSRRIVRRAQAGANKRIVFPEADNEIILRACHEITQEKIAKPVLIGNPEEIGMRAKELKLELDGVEIVHHVQSPRREQYAQDLFRVRQRKGMDLHTAQQWMQRPVEFGMMMVRSGDADGFVGGISLSYPGITRPALQIVGTRKDVRNVAGFYMLLYRDKTLFLADTTVNLEPDSETLADIAINTARAARFFGVTPKVALLSYSNFGSVRNPDLDRITRALRLIRQREPGLMADGEMQAHLSLDPVLRQKEFPFSQLEGAATVLVFPNLHASNNAYRLLSELSEGEIVGPILMGMDKPVNLLSQESLVRDVVNITAISALEAQEGVL